MKGKSSGETINIFSKTSNHYFYNLPPMKRMAERQKDGLFTAFLL